MDDYHDSANNRTWFYFEPIARFKIELKKRDLRGLVLRWASGTCVGVCIAGNGLL